MADFNHLEESDHSAYCIDHTRDLSRRILSYPELISNSSQKRGIRKFPV